MSYDMCGAENEEMTNVMRCHLPIGHKGIHEDYWGRKFEANIVDRARAQHDAMEGLLRHTGPLFATDVFGALAMVRDELRSQADEAVKRAAVGNGLVILTHFEARELADVIDRAIQRPTDTIRRISP